MRRNVLLGMMLACGLLAVTGRVLAHHSAAGLFSRQEEVVMTGAVKVWRMVNPHPALCLT